MEYGHTRQIPLAFAEAVEKTIDELGKKGFGILTEIDVKGTLKEKINAEFDNYIILGACNPPLAHKALLAEREIGLLLPCNVIVYEKEGKVLVSAIMPSVAMSVANNTELAAIAGEAEEKLKAAVNNI
ncbi:MAG: DUF302 domain-containing protein [Phycisphaerae bacterium]|nr:DUF302 domain-containing protein [Phycisphaerae bacterium]NIR49061.1 DUF302 domain-containing protein [candidate division KSB1 bacterium]NIS24566.1 DUF302 domain-containing protein [candidate division KSB1 bacterium]NIU25175.1 DUF302 domain-containing protein [candidate division KSB1 bacterium]NIV00817.1 DUF302 domain-containing protein [Phycisphaerae bacterium]